MARNFKNTALRLLGRRDLSRAKLVAGLEKRGCERAEALRIAEELASEGWLREDLYISARIRGWIRKGYSPRAIALLARREGLTLPDGEIERAYEELGTDEGAELRKLLERRARTWGGERESERARRRLLGAAARHGHEPGKTFNELGRRSSMVKRKRDEETPGG
ncbi:MAG: RecX family transcriptional regulator [Bdellovibrionales bacterium]|nr:RecX family transcriptional regulator [Bdellovibrionales bacterium]